MVLSIIGDSDTFVPKPWPKNVFQTALMEAAKSGEGNILYEDELNASSWSDLVIENNHYVMCVR